MVLFEVPGWQVPVAGPSTLPNSGDRKRKRPAATDDGSSKVNIDKLMKKITHAVAQSPEKEANRRARKGKGKKSVTGESARGQPAKASQERSVEVKDVSQLANSSNPERERKKAKKNKAKKETSSVADGTRADQSGQATSTDRMQTQESKSLTNLQSKMKGKLEGARFRWINETLYKAESRDAEKLMQEDPQVFEEYHTGFRHQVTSWPTNPVDIFTSRLSSYPERTVIIDLGCGDAALARALIPKGFSVLSYDLVSVNAFVTAADICNKLPLPGSETSADSQIVDVVVCSLSLMSTNWPKCIREARRVLKAGGELKVAEVASRLTDIKKFVALVNSIGFRLASKDESNTHFTLFEFRKTDGFPKYEDDAWQDVLSKGHVLQPCEYKRR